MALESLVGKTVSHDRITRRLGAGGMGVVYEAEQPELPEAKVAQAWILYARGQ